MLSRVTPGARRIRWPVAAFLVTALSACSTVRDDVEVWRFAIEETRGSVQDRYATRFEELIESRSDGAIDVKVYPYGTLGTSDHITELLHNGTVQFAMSSPGHLGKLIPEVQVLLLHFVLSDDEQVNNRVLQHPDLHAIFDDLYADKGFELLAIYSEGWMTWTANEPLVDLEAFDGFKIRVMTSPLLLEAYEAYGASPTPLPYSEVYSALQLSMIDGQVNPIFAIQEMSFHEVNDHLIFPNHAPFVTTAAANRQFYQSLSPEHRTMVDEVVAELQDYVIEVQRTFNRDRLALIRERRPEIQTIELSDAQREAFRQASLPVRETYLTLAPERGEEVLRTLLRAVEEEEEQ